MSLVEIPKYILTRMKIMAIDFLKECIEKNGFLKKFKIKMIKYLIL